MTVARPSYHYNGNTCSGQTIYFYWDGPQEYIIVIIRFQWRHVMIKTSQNHWQLEWSFNNLFILTTNNRAPHYWSFVRGIHMWPVDSLTKAVDVESWRDCPGGLSHKFRKNYDVMTWISLRKGQQLGNNFHGTTTSYVKMMTLLQHFHSRYRVWNHIEIKICIYLNSTVLD